MASRKAARKGSTKHTQRTSSNVFSMFEQSQIQEFKEAFGCIDQNRDGIISKQDLKETFVQLGKMNVKDEELDEMLKEGKGPMNFTVFLSLFGEKLNGTDPEETILNAFKLFDPQGTGTINKDDFDLTSDSGVISTLKYGIGVAPSHTVIRAKFKRLLMTQADKFSAEEVQQMFSVSPIDVTGNIDYKSLCYIITHGDEKEEA
ncbi:myosin regulatory light chain 2, atrial isoform isoform X1 [Mobula birostris]|uniref:myosin regulatory light chain 2, atrial isoform isoform X1 n=1 Tax=Mobula birostris TaxID=1983395 RepID=UPI003B28D5DD